MKTRYVYFTSAILILFLVAFVWKLNDYYRVEKTSLYQDKLHQQTLSLKTAVSTQLTQLKNTLAAYIYKVHEQDINWQQLDPFIALGQVELKSGLQLELKNLYSKSGSKAERWTKDFLQKGLVLSKKSSSQIIAKLFQTKSGDKFMALVFLNQPAATSEGLVVVGEASYFQKFFDLQRSSKVKQLLLTDEGIVAAHTVSDYIASPSEEGRLSSKTYFVDSDDLRSTNMRVISYARRAEVFSWLNVPPTLLGIVIGFSLVLLGVLFYFQEPLFKAILQQKQKAKTDAFSREVQRQQSITPAQPAPLHSTIPAEISQSHLTPSENRLVHKTLPEPSLPTVSVLPTLPPILPPPSLLSQPISSSPAFMADNPINENTQRISDINEVLKRSLQTLEQNPAYGRTTFTTDFKARSSVAFDEVRVQKMFENILLNALEATADRPQPTIFVRSYDKDEGVIVEIQDNGGGIPSYEIEKVWQPFFTTKDKKHHRGLGLAEALSVARRFGGDILLINHPQGGVLVKVLLGVESSQEKSSEQKIEGAQPHQAQAEFLPEEITRKIEDIDIDSILSLDTEDEVDLTETGKTAARASGQSDGLRASNVQELMTATHFQLDQALSFDENPQISLDRKKHDVDEAFETHVRRPLKS